MYRRCFFVFITAGCVLFCFCGSAFAIVLHPQAEPNLSQWTDRPSNNVVGRWNNNASFVVIYPKWIATTCHQGGSPAQVVIDGTAYNCIYNSAWSGGPTGQVDIRLVRLKKLDGSDPNLEFAPPYKIADEIGREVVVGGYGRGRGGILGGTFSQRTYGYTWAAGENSSNDVLRWCTNRTAGSRISYSGSRVSKVITADFDDPCSTLYEGIPAEYDSGGGWFIKTASGWKTAGLTRGVTVHGQPWPAAGQSWYRDSWSPEIQYPDTMDAVRISDYADWINSIITEAECESPPQGDLSGNCKVDLVDFAFFAKQWLRSDCSSSNNYCDGADFPDTRDGFIDQSDLIAFSQNWLADMSAPLPQ